MCLLVICKALGSVSSTTEEKVMGGVGGMEGEKEKGKEKENEKETHEQLTNEQPRLRCSVLG